MPLPIACGVSHVPFLVFSIGSAISSLVWSLIFSWLGWWLGETVLNVFGHVKKFEPLIGVLVILSMIVGFIIVRRRHVADAAAHVIDPDQQP